jgi:nucleotide-binding universal stress UspA family protein
MPQIKKILFPVDFSDSCQGAARYVEAFAGRFEASIMLLHAVDMGEQNLADDLVPQRQAQLDAFLVDELKYFKTERLCVPGDASAGIVDTARRWGTDLVMMPTRGHGLFRRLLFGSITAKVLHDLDCPVWTGIHAERAPQLEDIHCRRVLCAVDLTERSQSILEWARWLAREYQAELGIVHATAELPAAYAGWNLVDEFTRCVSAQATTQIEALQAEGSTANRVFINPGDPAKVVAGAVKDFDADLLVLGRHGGGGTAGFLRHNAYAILRESPCPVISV